MEPIRTVAWTGDAIRLIDQTRLPTSEEYVEIRDWRDAVGAIRRMVVRGAPAIGCTAALAMALAARENAQEDRAGFRMGMERAADALRGSRPTAVNLFWAIDRISHVMDSAGNSAELSAAVEREAVQMLEEDVETNRRLGRFGADLMPESGSILTHCNAGALCASGYGTALGVVRAAVEAGKQIHVFADETRPRLQGLKLTAWELQRDGIPVTVIADNMSASLMREGRIHCVVVGADRIAANGDTANKIGTYGVAILAKHHGIPFYVAAPLSTIDFNLKDGASIPIEQRASDEMTHIDGIQISPEGVSTLNPAFDITPFSLITAIFTEYGVVKPPFLESIATIASSISGKSGQSNNLLEGIYVI